MLASHQDHQKVCLLVPRIKSGEWSDMGEVRKPENVSRRRPRIQTPDIPYIQSPSLSLEDLLQEIQTLKNEILKIKQVMRSHGISIERS